MVQVQPLWFHVFSCSSMCRHIVLCGTSWGRSNIPSNSSVMGWKDHGNYDHLRYVSNIIYTWYICMCVCVKGCVLFSTSTRLVSCEYESSAIYHGGLARWKNKAKHKAIRSDSPFTCQSLIILQRGAQVRWSFPGFIRGYMYIYHIYRHTLYIKYIYIYPYHVYVYTYA